jgi:predicted MFS family arabinose efflux permease
MSDQATSTAASGILAAVTADPVRTNPWPAVLSVALGAAVFCTTEFLPVGLLRYVSEGLWVTEGTAGLMVSVPGVLAAIAAPFLTVAVGNRDRRHVLLLLAALLVASNLLAMVSTNFGMLLAARVLFGIGLGGFWAIGAGLGARLVGAGSVGSATSIIFAGVSVGMLVGGAAGALISDLFGWRAAFGVPAALSLIAFIAQWTTLPALRVAQRIRPRDVLGIVRTPAGRAGLAAMTLALCGQFSTYTYITPFLAKQGGFDGKALSSVLLGYTLIGLLGNFVGGAAAEKCVKLTLSATIALAAVSMLLLPLVSPVMGPTLASIAVWGLAYGAMPVALQMWMAAAAPKAPEGAMALFVANFQISIAVGSLVGGAAFDHFGAGASMYLGATLAMLGLITLWTFSPAALPAPAQDAVG